MDDGPLLQWQQQRLQLPLPLLKLKFMEGNNESRRSGQNCLEEPDVE